MVFSSCKPVSYIGFMIKRKREIFRSILTGEGAIVKAYDYNGCLAFDMLSVLCLRVTLRTISPAHDDNIGHTYVSIPI